MKIMWKSAESRQIKAKLTEESAKNLQDEFIYYVRLLKSSKTNDSMNINMEYYQILSVKRSTWTSSIVIDWDFSLCDRA